MVLNSSWKRLVAILALVVIGQLVFVEPASAMRRGGVRHGGSHGPGGGPGGPSRHAGPSGPGGPGRHGAGGFHGGFHGAHFHHFHVGFRPRPLLWHPVGFFLLGGNEPDHLFRQALGRGIGLDNRFKAIFILVDVNFLDALNCFNIGHSRLSLPAIRSGSRRTRHMACGNFRPTV